MVEGDVGLIDGEPSVGALCASIDVCLPCDVGAHVLRSLCLAGLRAEMAAEEVEDLGPAIDG